MDGFDFLKLELAGENVRALVAEFRSKSDRDVKISFEELSDGQRCLIRLNAIIHFILPRGNTVVIDEPDNFVALREIQPWLMAATDIVDGRCGQLVIISHHPELMNKWAPQWGVEFLRDDIGAVHLEDFRGEPQSSLSPSELIARGWNRE